MRSPLRLSRCAKPYVYATPQLREPTQYQSPNAPANRLTQFLAFDTYPEWATTFIKSVTIKSSAIDPPSPSTLQRDDYLTVSLPSATFSPKVLINKPEQFQWEGALPYVFVGAHSFEFLPSEETPGCTKVVQKEEFSGALSFLVGEDWRWGKTTKEGFEGFNRDLKARVESLGKEGVASPAPAGLTPAEGGEPKVGSVSGQVAQGADQPQSLLTTPPAAQATIS